MSPSENSRTAAHHRAGTASRTWHLLIVVDVVAALIIQLALILTGGATPTRARPSPRWGSSPG